MWLALIMAANVWFVIWPNQKRALGIVGGGRRFEGKVGAQSGNDRLADQCLALNSDAACDD